MCSCFGEFENTLNICNNKTKMTINKRFATLSMIFLNHIMHTYTSFSPFLSSGLIFSAHYQIYDEFVKYTNTKMQDLNTVYQSIKHANQAIYHMDHLFGCIRTMKYTKYTYHSRSRGSLALWFRLQDPTMILR